MTYLFSKDCQITRTTATRYYSAPTPWVTMPWGTLWEGVSVSMTCRAAINPRIYLPKKATHVHWSTISHIIFLICYTCTHFSTIDVFMMIFFFWKWNFIKKIYNYLNDKKVERFINLILLSTTDWEKLLVFIRYQIEEITLYWCAVQN